MVEAVSTAVTTAMKHHEAVFHRDEVVSCVKKAVDEHKATCAGATSVHKIEKIVRALYVKAGGDLESLDL